MEPGNTNPKIHTLACSGAFLHLNAHGVGSRNTRVGTGRSPKHRVSAQPQFPERRADGGNHAIDKQQT